MIIVAQWLCLGNTYYVVHIIKIQSKRIQCIFNERWNHRGWKTNWTRGISILGEKNNEFPRYLWLKKHCLIFKIKLRIAVKIFPWFNSWICHYVQLEINYHRILYWCDWREEYVVTNRRPIRPWERISPRW